MGIGSKVGDITLGREGTGFEVTKTDGMNKTGSVGTGFFVGICIFIGTKSKGATTKTGFVVGVSNTLGKNKTGCGNRLYRRSLKYTRHQVLRINNS
jgi:hypothetical protein